VEFPRTCLLRPAPPPVLSSGGGTRRRGGARRRGSIWLLAPLAWLLRASRIWRSAVPAAGVRNTPPRAVYVVAARCRSLALPGALSSFCHKVCFLLHLDLPWGTLHVDLRKCLLLHSLFTLSWYVRRDTTIGKVMAPSSGCCVPCGTLSRVLRSFLICSRLRESNL